ncbi:MAG: B12-binding domain-containing radical SAM protein, partial [Anaerolineales bacterium]
MTHDIPSYDIQSLLTRVQKPGRYTGGELNQIVKPWEQTRTRIALAFPDIYDLGMSNLGLAILYDLINHEEDMLAERTFSPWADMEHAMRQAEIPLFSLETHRPIGEFDILGISLPYETLYTNTLNLLDLARIPIRSELRSIEDPLIIAGGHATLNPEPMAPFIDAFVIGEGEDVMLEIARTYQGWKDSGEDRQALLRSLASLWGVYVPDLYRVHYLENGTLSHVESLAPEAPMPVLKRIVSKLPPPVTRFIVPFIDITHNRIPIEIMRGCTRGCRFCQAGMITRPVRERPVE